NYRVTLDSSYLYDQTAENSAIRYAVPAGKLVEVLRSGAGADNTPWVEVKYGGYTGYMPERLLRQATHAELQAGGIVTPTPTSGAQAIYWVVNVQGNAYMRQAPNTASTALTKVAGGTVLPQKEKTQGVDGYTWMQLTHAQWVGYIRSDLLRAATVSEIVAAGYPPPSAGATPTPAPTSGGNNPVNTMLAVRGSGTNLRTGMGTSFGMVCKLRRDQVLTVLGTGTGADGLLWYRVTADGQTGNVRGDLLRELTAAEKALYGQNSGGGSTGGTTSYRVLTVGSTGEDVLKMQQKLKETGYLQVTSVTNYYGTLTRDAVTNFQRNNGLYADGIATVETQHKLYGTAPSTGGGGNTGGGSVEMADWFGSNIRSQLESQRIFTVIDVATRKSFQVRFFNGKQHADVEPVTKADTAVMMSGTGGDRIFGSYRRPVWVQVNGHTYAASMYAVAHGEEQAIKDNDFEGVCCIHFLNSTTHVDPNSPNAEHQASIQKAYEAGKKK
ncbi:MAG: SH3 domain-containing protein, partial [Clostridia bacterium]